MVVSITASNANENLNALASFLADEADPVVQLDVLRGLSDGLAGQRSAAMPEGWTEVEQQLGRSPNAEVRSLTQALSLKFGSPVALAALRRSATDKASAPQERRGALQALVDFRDPELAPLIAELLGDPAMRGDAVRAASAYIEPAVTSRLVEVFDDLTAQERREATAALTSRPDSALVMLKGVESGGIPRSAITADVARQLNGFNNDKISNLVKKVWGTAAVSSEEKKAEIARLKGVYWAGGSQPGDASRGRAVFAQACQQCHKLFGTGGSVGPDLTGSDRANIDYILENIVSPNAVVPNQYLTSVIETHDGRFLTGVIAEEDASSVEFQTVTERVKIPRDEISMLERTEISMMPEGLLVGMPDQSIRDLIYYLRSPAQAPLPGTAETASLFFNGTDLTNWDGDEDVWSVENREIVGSTKEGLRHNNFLTSQMMLEDFRLVFEVKLTPNSENSGVQFRSVRIEGGEMRGYQADIGQGWWGKLYEESARGLLWDKDGEEWLRPGDWNTYEIVAVGHHILTAINGHKCVDLVDPEGDLKGIIGLQVHSGGPMEIRFRKFELEINPTAELRTVTAE